MREKIFIEKSPYPNSKTRISKFRACHLFRFPSYYLVWKCLTVIKRIRQIFEANRKYTIISRFCIEFKQGNR